MIATPLRALRAPTLRALAALVALAAAAPPARADDPTRRGFDPDPARLALGRDGGFAVETAAPPSAPGLASRIVLDWAAGLLALRLGGERDLALEHRLSLHLAASWAPRRLPRLELGLHAPVALYQASDLSILTSRGIGPPLAAPIGRTALGDLRAVARWAALPEDRLGVGVAALLDLRLPTGDPDAFTSDGWMAVPGLAATRHLGEVRLDANLGYALRGEGQWAQLVVHDGLVYGLGASGDLPRPRALAGLRGIAELTGGWPRGAGGGTERYRAPLSVRGGLRAALGRALGGVLSVELGAGAGLGEAGYGREAWRVFAGLRLAPPPRAPGAEPDPDGDGLTGPGDRCPREAGPAELDGCPDRDGDAIPDPQDRCPDRPGPAKQEGCPPPEQEPDVVVETDRISLKDAINFDTGRATIKQGSFPILDKVAALLVARPELGRVRIEGHTDNVGGAAYNRDLSRRRAQAVVDHLAARGVARARLVAEGFGFDRPVADNATALGRAKNRRVEFTILSEGAP